MLRLSRDIELQWPVGDETARAEARAEESELIAQGYRVTFYGMEGDAMFTRMSMTDPIAHCLRILTKNGDDIIVWDRDDLTQIKEAERRFKECIESGYRAYIVGKNGKKGSRIDYFDDVLEEILLVPATIPG